MQDLHRTGHSNFTGIENEEDRVILQRVLLGYARWNKVTGYCQGFNIIAASILGVTEKNEADALKVMRRIFLVMIASLLWWICVLRYPLFPQLQLSMERPPRPWQYNCPTL